MSMPTDTQPAPTTTRRRAAAAAAVVVVLVAGIVGLTLLLGNDDGSPAAASAQTSAAPTQAEASIPPAPPTPEPTGPTEDAVELPAALPEVPLDATADAGNGVTASLPAVRGIQGTATGPGNIAGPAVQVTVRITNGTEAPVSVSGVAVNTYYTDERTPASPLDDPSQKPLAGMLEPGESAEGVYVFSVPAEFREMVTVEVGYQAGAPLLLFTGAVR